MQYAPSTLSIARDHITAILQSYGAATGLPEYFVRQLATGAKNSAFNTRYLGGDFRIGTYDKINGRMSALWPRGAAWPEGIPRQAPIEIEPELMSALAFKLKDKSDLARTGLDTWPAGIAWPKDIPRPKKAAGQPAAAG